MKVGTLCHCKTLWSQFELKCIRRTFCFKGTGTFRIRLELSQKNAIQLLGSPFHPKNALKLTFSAYKMKVRFIKGHL